MANNPKINYVFFAEQAETGNSPALNIYGDYEKMNIEVSGTATSHTLIFEAQGIDDSWVEIGVVNLTTGATVKDIAVKGLLRLDLTGFIKVRAKITAVAGGNLTVKGRVVG